MSSSVPQRRPAAPPGELAARALTMRPHHWGLALLLAAALALQAAEASQESGWRACFALGAREAALCEVECSACDRRGPAASPPR